MLHLLTCAFCLLKGAIKDIKGSEVKQEKVFVIFFFQLFIHCPIRNNASFYGKIKI